MREVSAAIFICGLRILLMSAFADLDADALRKLNAECGVVLCLGRVPAGSEFGVDCLAWRVGAKFAGVKLIPPGAHYVYWSAADAPESDLERAMPMTDNEIARANLKMLHRVLVLALVVAGVSITLSVVSSIVVWGAVARASEVASVVSEHITASEIDHAVQSAFGSIHDVKSTTGSAANLAFEVETAGDRVVAAVNASASVLERLTAVASRLADHPSVSLALGTGGR